MSLANITIRPLEAGDDREFLSLFETVHGTRRPVEWFEWKYVTNPVIDHVPILGAFDESTLIGVRPLFAIPLRDGEWRGLGLEQSDAMVHPAYRRQGIFSQLVERTIERYKTADVGLFFSFPNQASWAAYRKLGWKRVGPVIEGFKLYRPGSIGATRGIVPEQLAQTADTIGQAVQQLSGIGYPEPAGIETDLVAGVPAERIASLAATQRPDTIHTDRTEAFLDWRFRNPDWHYSTVIAHQHGTDQAAIITGTGTNGAVGTITRIIDIVPLIGHHNWERSIDVLLGTVIDTHSNSNVFVLPSDRIPQAIRRKHAFFSDHRKPLSMVAEPTDLVVRPVSTGLPEERVTKRSAWSPSFIEYDTS